MKKSNSPAKSNVGSGAGDLPAGLSKPAMRALTGAGYTRLNQFTQLTEAEILRLHGVGPDAIKKLRAAEEKTFASSDR